MNLQVLEQEMIQAKPYFQTMSPSWTGLVKHKLMKIIGLGWLAIKKTREWQAGKAAHDLTGEFLGDFLLKTVSSAPRAQVSRLFVHAQHVTPKNFSGPRKNGLGGHGWFGRPGQQPLVVVYHDARKAGPHLDIHVGRVSLIRRVKPEVNAQLKFNSQGFLTQDSKRLLLDFLRQEISNSSRVPQNLDHTVTNAKMSWVNGDPETGKYGAGTTRQVILDSKVDVFKTSYDGPMEIYAPDINPHRGMYIHRLYPGTSTRSPILVWGNLKPSIPNLEDRLHLKMVLPHQADKLETRADLTTATVKYDGSSCYVVITPKGTHVWSPRLSVRTNERIEYTFKLDGIANVTSDVRIVAMGELLFRQRRWFVWQRKYLPQSVSSGILNSNRVLDPNIRPEVRLYRVDRIGRQRTLDLPFWENRELQQQVAELSNLFAVVDLIDHNKIRKLDFEGFVVAPVDGSINDGWKVKFWGDTYDWKIDQVAFEPGPRGAVAGVVHCTSLESGKKFKLGPGQVGDTALTTSMMLYPEQYAGRVLTVASRVGHEGRASKVQGLHSDK